MTPSKIKLIDYFKSNYNKKSKDEIIKDTNLSWNYIQKIACLNKIKKGSNESKNNSKYSKIIDYNDNITCYWIGFILADGHIYKESNIQINLSIKDKEYILKIEEHIGKVCKYEYKDDIRLVISDRKSVSKLSNDFNWLSNKTKNPVKIPDNITNDQLFSMMIGFIDGDGCINKKGLLYLKCDSSWGYFLEEVYYILTSSKKNFYISPDGCSNICITKNKEVLKIKNRALSLNLPIMNRKWDRVVDRTLKCDKYNIIQNLLIEGHDIKKIKENTGFSQSLIYKVKKDLKWK